MEASKRVPKAIVLEFLRLVKFEELHHNCIELPFPRYAFTPSQSIYLWVLIDELVIGIVLNLGFCFNLLGDQPK